MEKTLYQAVKDKLLESEQVPLVPLDTKLLGTAGGYTNGRLLDTPFQFSFWTL